MFPFINTSMLRERFVIREANKSGKQMEPVIALGNRIAIPLKGADGRLMEYFIIRGQNMHSAARMAARLFQDFNRTGPILPRIPTYDWTGGWQTVCSSYEDAYNKDNWIAVYHKGRIVFKAGAHHPFLDVIEQCEATNRDDYDKATKIAEDIFMRAGKAVKIEKQTTIAAVIGVADRKSRCGVIFRNPKRATTFNFTIEPKNEPHSKPADPTHCLNMTGAYLEGIQLAFTVGRLNVMIESRKLSKTSPEAKQAQAAQLRIGRLNAEIKNYENMFDLKYRPERPDLFNVIRDTESVLDDA